MSTIKLSSITNKAKTSGPVIVGVTSSTAEGYARLASGDNSERVGIESGSIRYNETAKLLEFYDGETWNFIIPAEESANALGVFGGGATANYVSTIDYITISTLGDAIDFGDLTLERGAAGACSSSTRGVFGGGYSGSIAPTVFNIIDYITIATTGNATDFGDLTQGYYAFTACSSSTRGVFGGGYANVINYVTIATTGNAKDFGDLTQLKGALSACSSSTRGVFGGGFNNPVGSTNRIDYITIASQGTNATTFGDLTVAREGLAACSSSTRGVFGGGSVGRFGASSSVVIDYITIATTGNATDFGDITTPISWYFASCSSSIRGVFGGGGFFGGAQNTIEYITIATTGNATDFGDLTQARSYFSACSNNHGGLL